MFTILGCKGRSLASVSCLVCNWVGRPICIQDAIIIISSSLMELCEFRKCGD